MHQIPFTIGGFACSAISPGGCCGLEWSWTVLRGVTLSRSRLAGCFLPRSASPSSPHPALGRILVLLVAGAAALFRRFIARLQRGLQPRRAGSRLPRTVGVNSLSPAAQPGDLVALVCLQPPHRWGRWATCIRHRRPPWSLPEGVAAVPDRRRPTSRTRLAVARWLGRALRLAGWRLTCPPCGNHSRPGRPRSRPATRGYRPKPRRPEAGRQPPRAPLSTKKLWRTTMFKLGDRRRPAARRPSLGPAQRRSWPGLISQARAGARSGSTLEAPRRLGPPDVADPSRRSAGGGRRSASGGGLGVALDVGRADAPAEGSRGPEVGPVEDSAIYRAR